MKQAQRDPVCGYCGAGLGEDPMVADWQLSHGFCGDYCAEKIGHYAHQTAGVEFDCYCGICAEEAEEAARA